jgi:hypothetical protein
MLYLVQVRVPPLLPAKRPLFPLRPRPEPGTSPDSIVAIAQLSLGGRVLASLKCDRGSDVSLGYYEGTSRRLTCANRIPIWRRR